MTKHEAAQAALGAHDRLQEAQAREPELMQDGMPFDPDLWLAWHSTDYKPAYEGWSAAMDALSVAIGESIGRHPSTFRPLCEELART